VADVAKFAILLEDLLSPGAKQAKASIVSLSNELTTAKGKLAGYQSQLALSKELGDIAGHRKYSALVGESKRGIFDLTQRLESAQSTMGASAVEAEGLAASLGLVAAGAAAAVAGLALVGAGVMKALKEANEQQLMIARFEALGTRKGAGAETLAMLDQLGAKLPQSEAQLVGWTKQLQAMGITDLSQIRSELVSIASAQAVMGDEGAAAYMKIQERVRLAVEAHHGLKLAEKSLTALYKAGVNETEVAKRMGLTTAELGAKLKAGTIDAQKFGEALSAAVKEKGKGPLDVMMNSLESMAHKAYKAFGDLFEDVDTKPLTDALRNLINLGDTPAGDGLKMGLTGALNAVIRMLGYTITEAEVFFLEFEVKALQAYIALKPLIGAVTKIGNVMGALSPTPAGGAGSEGGAGATVDKARLAGEAAFTGVVGPIALIPGLMWDALAAIGNDRAQAIARASGVAAGEATIEGIREGVQAHSPSVAAIKIGADIGAGLGMGMDQSPAPERAARTISANALGGLTARGGLLGGAPANDGGNATTIGPITIHITAPDGVTDAQELSIVGLSAALERYQIGSGR
jgi:hypothetical protein